MNKMSWTDSEHDSERKIVRLSRKRDTGLRGWRQTKEERVKKINICINGNWEGDKKINVASQ